MIQKNGVGYCNVDSWMAKEWSRAYQWMVDQMYKQIEKPELNNIKWPLWAWQYYNGITSPQYICKKIIYYAKGNKRKHA